MHTPNGTDAPVFLFPESYDFCNIFPAFPFIGRALIKTSCKCLCGSQNRAYFRATNQLLDEFGVGLAGQC